MSKKGLCVFGWSLGVVLCVLWLGALRAHFDFESENTGYSIITHAASPQFLGDIKPLLCDKIFDPKVRATEPILCVFHRLSEDETKRLITRLSFVQNLQRVKRAFATFLEYRASQLLLQTQLGEKQLNCHAGFIKWLLRQSGFREQWRHQEITGVVYKLVQQIDAASYIQEQSVRDVTELLEQQSLDSGVQA
ncbi:MAG: hypothetical protein ACPGUZ_02110 [Holosporaceae bacterium]